MFHVNATDRLGQRMLIFEAATLNAVVEQCRAFGCVPYRIMHHAEGHPARIVYISEFPQHLGRGPWIASRKPLECVAAMRCKL